MKRLLALSLWLLAAPPALAVVSLVPTPQAPTQAYAPPSDDAHCSTCDGIALMDDGQYARAMHIFQLRAAEGDPLAITQIGYMYENGYGVPVDLAKARGYYNKAIKLGGGSGLTYLGMMVERGKGGRPDYAGAMKLYRSAFAKDSNALAANQIGFMLQNGLGQPADRDAAFCWYEFAAMKGNVRAQGHLQYLINTRSGPPTNCSIVPVGDHFNISVVRPGQP
jgi:TPR repeat protein